MRNFQTFDDAMGKPTDIMSLSDSRFLVVLSAGVAKTVTVPPDAGNVVFSATAPFWAQYGAAAALPTKDRLDGTAPELSPNARRIAGTSSLGLVAATDCVVSLSFFG